MGDRGGSKRWADMFEDAEDCRYQLCEEDDLEEANGAQAHPRQWSTWLPSAGSIHHPHLCQKPCRFIIDARGCAEGDGCGFCHLDHNRRWSSTLDKKNRETAKLLGSGLASLLRPILAEKVEQRGLGPGAAAALQKWSSLAEASGQRVGLPGGLRPFDITRLLRMLQSMPLNMVCRALTQHSGSPVLCSATKDLFVGLRAAARAGQ